MARFNFSLDDDAMLDNLQKLTKRTSKADVIRDALSLYNYLAGKAIEGDNIYIGPKVDSAREVAVTTLEAVKLRNRK